MTEKKINWSGWRAAGRTVASAIPVVLVNATAFVGQFAFIQDHVHGSIFSHLAGQLLIALTFESVAVYLAWSAHVATMANDSATRLKLGAYGFALVMGCMNYSHYAGAHLAPTFLAVGMFLMSAASPALWGVHTRRASRDKLMSLGLVEEHAVRLGANRMLWHPWRSVRVLSGAAWDGETDPKRAIELYGAPRQPRRTVAQEVPPQVPAAPVAAQPVPPAIGPAPQPAPSPVQAAANLTAAPKLGAQSHPIDPQVQADVQARLILTPVDKNFPSQREVSKMLCPENHDHRRMARNLMARAKDPATRAAAVRTNGHRPTGTGGFIATPLATLPGGTSN